MRTADVVLRAGDRLPKVRRTASVDGAVLDLTGYTVTFNYQPVAGGTLVSTAATIVAPPTGGIVEYQWQASDAAQDPGFYAAWFEVSNAGLTLSLPNDGFLLLQIVADGTAEFSYSGDPGARPLDAVRWLIGDTDPNNPQQRDAEILWALSQYNDSTYLAAASCAETLAGVYAAVASKSRTVGDLTVAERHQNRSQEYRAHADRLRAQAASLNPPVPTATSAATAAQFAIGQMDNPGVTTSLLLS